MHSVKGKALGSLLAAPSTRSIQIFLKTRIFFLLSKYYASTRGVLKSFLSIHTKTLKRCTCDSVPYRACVERCMSTPSHWKTIVLVLPCENNNPAFSKISTFSVPKMVFTCERKANGVKSMIFQKYQSKC